MERHRLGAGRGERNQEVRRARAERRLAEAYRADHPEADDKRLALAEVTENGGAPCGACRQVLTEFADDRCPVILLNGQGDIVLETTVGALLPRAFRL